MKMASSVELGPGRRLETARRSRKSWGGIQRRRRTSWSSIMAIWAAGPPKAMAPSLRKKAARSRRGGGGREAVSGEDSIGGDCEWGWFYSGHLALGSRLMIWTSGLAGFWGRR